MSFTYRAGHLSDAVDLYVDGALDAESSRRAARHLLVCSRCRGEVDSERAIVRSVRRVRLDPERHATLVADLLALAPSCVGGATATGGDSRAQHPHSQEMGVSRRVTVRTLGDGRSVARAIVERGPVQGARRPHERRTGRAAAGAAMALGVAAVVLAFVPGARTQPVAPRLAQHASSDLDRPGAARIVVVSQASGPGGVMRANRTASGRMNP